MSLIGKKVKAKGVKGKTTVTKVDSDGVPIEGINEGEIVDLVKTGFRVYGILKALWQVIQKFFVK